MASVCPQDRVSLCRFTFSDHRKCLTPRAPTHPHFCYFHARSEARSLGAEKLARDFQYLLSAPYLSANDLNAAIGRLFPALVRGDIKPRTASTLAYLAQTLAQTIPIAQKEYVYAFGTPAWGKVIRTSVNQVTDYTNNPDPPAPAPQPTPEPQPDPEPAASPTPEPDPEPVPEPQPESVPTSAASSPDSVADPDPAPQSSPPATKPNPSHPRRPSRTKKTLPVPPDPSTSAPIAPPPTPST